jgi:Uma2 family endonuclease
MMPIPTVSTAPPTLVPGLTAEALFALGERPPCELVDGRIVPVPPTGAIHGRTELQLRRIIADFAERHDLGWVLVGEVGLITRRDPDRVRGADAVLVARSQSLTLPEGFLDFGPAAVFEIISPNDRWREIQDKLDEYFAIGCGQVWMVDPQRRQVTVYTGPTSGERFAVQARIAGTGILEGLDLAVSRLFAD